MRLASKIRAVCISKNQLMNTFNYLNFKAFPTFPMLKRRNGLFVESHDADSELVIEDNDSRMIRAKLL